MSEINEDKVTLRGVVISREALGEKYNTELTDTEWTIFKSSIQKSWKEDDAELRKLVFKHVKTSFEQIGFGLKLDGTNLVFRKK